MVLKTKWGFKPEILLLFLIMLTIFGCASIQRPQGGPRDRTPPKLLKATPLNSTRNFNSKVIKLDFDEYFKLSNQFQEITMSPAQERNPDYKIKDKSLIITFKDTLQKNTTYVFNFGKGIIDVNEGNILKNFTYVLSTGPHIDSLSISGNVINTLTQEREKEATVMLFPVKLDTAYFGKKKPAIYTTTDTAGNFALNNLHEGDYRIYALKESAVNKIYDNENELIAFLKNVVHIDKDSSNIQLRLFKQTSAKFRVVEKRFDLDGKMFFTFNKPLNNPSVKINYPASFNDEKQFDFSKTKDSAYIYIRNTDFDSISVSFLDGAKIMDTLSLRKGRKETFQRTLNLLYSISNNQMLKPNTDFVFTTSFPIESTDASRIVLLEDSASVSNFTLVKDPNNLRKYILKYRWRQNSKYEMRINEGTFVDMFGDKNKLAIKKFSVDKPENYGTITLKISVPDTAKRSYVVELLNEQKQVMRTDIITKKATLDYRDYPTGKYRVRIVYDANGNGKWDSGNVKQGIYPENIWVDPAVITLRANWQAEETVDIPREPINP